MKGKLLRRLVVIPLALMLAAAAGAQGKDTDSDSDRWEFTFAPYFLVPTIKVDSKVRGFSSSVKLDPGDIIDNLSFGWMSYMELRKNRLGFFLDGLYMKLEDDVRAGLAKADVTVEQGMATFGAMYRIGKPELSIDPIIGGRYVYLKLDLDFARLRDVSQSGGFIEPIVGARVNVALSEKWSFHLRGNVGGFGIGSASESTWDVRGLFFYQLSDKTSLAFGYRYTDMDYDQSISIQEKIYGPFAGVAFTF